ncbi:MAG: aldehyde dehydrogenase family protein [Planctomycetota bacterium]
MGSEVRAYLRFHLASGVGPVLFRRMVEAFGDVETTAQAGPRQWARVEGMGPKRAEAISEVSETRIDEELAAAEAASVRILCWSDPGYPDALKTIYDHPPVVYVRGQLDKADAVAMGLRLNGSQTCMAPRRIMVHRDAAPRFRDALLQRVANVPAAPVSDSVREQLAGLLRDAEAAGAAKLTGGVERNTVRPIVLDGVTPDMAIARADVFAPVCSLIMVKDDDAVVAADAACPYGLTASIFGNAAAARDLAQRLNVGVVTINDLYAPTVDPRVPFGGTRRSGFGVTRGAEGLLGMTRPRVVQARRGSARPHLEVMTDDTAAMVRAYLGAAHGRGWRRRLFAVREMMQAGRRWWAAKRSPSGRG